jgi:hypothetical protein
VDLLYDFMGRISTQEHPSFHSSPKYFRMLNNLIGFPPVQVKVCPALKHVGSSHLYCNVAQIMKQDASAPRREPSFVCYKVQNQESCTTAHGYHQLQQTRFQGTVRIEEELEYRKERRSFHFSPKYFEPLVALHSVQVKVWPAVFFRAC